MRHAFFIGPERVSAVVADYDLVRNGFKSRFSFRRQRTAANDKQLVQIFFEVLQQNQVIFIDNAVFVGEKIYPQPSDRFYLCQLQSNRFLYAKMKSSNGES